MGLYAQEGGTGFPVGKVDMLDMYPLSFAEFLGALGEDNFVEAIRRHEWDTLQTFAERLEDLLRLYYFVGGMPEVVADFAEHHDFVAVRRRQDAILRGYRQDFGARSVLPLPAKGMPSCAATGRTSASMPRHQRRDISPPRGSISPSSLHRNERNFA